jgi:hypothetical protein
MKNLDRPSISIQGQMENWELVDSLYGGTTTMRDAHETLLPREPKETDINYEARLKRTTLFNAYKRTIQSSVGKVFSREIMIDTESPEVLTLIDNVDQSGRDLTEFAADVFTDAMNKGVSYILVDHTQTIGTGPEGVITRADEIEQGARPYWINIKASQVRAAVTEMINGMEILTYFRYVEETTEFDESTHQEERTTVVRVLRLDRDNGNVLFETFYQEEEEKNLLRLKAKNQSNTVKDNPLLLLDSDEWIKDEEKSGVLSSNIYRIPIIPVITNRVSSFLGSPPLMDLAEKNVEYWQSYSDQKTILHYARVPIFTISGIKQLNDVDEDSSPDMEISGNSVLELGKDGKAEWVEHGGKAIEAGRQDIQDIKAEMSVLGLELYISRPGTETATAKAINNAETNSWLKTMALSLRNAIEKALIYSAQYGGFPPEQIGDVMVNTEYSIPFRDTEDMKFLLEMYKEGLLDPITLLTEAKRRNLLYYTTNVDDLAILSMNDDDNPPPTNNESNETDNSDETEDDNNNPDEN